MASFDGTGVVVKTSADSCDVFVVIHNMSRLFTFSKGMFYIIGKRCAVDIDMFDALEFGMNVNVCYKISSLDGKPFLIAVWIGVKPDVLTETESIYNQRGLVRYDTCEHLVVRDDDTNRCVFIDKNVVFPFGEKFVEGKGGRIMYDAVMKDDNSRIYEATCAWIEEKKPNVYDRFFRDVKDVQTDEITGPVRGVVSVIPCDDVVVDVDIDCKYIKVLLMRKNFDVHVGDVLCLRVNFCEAQKDGFEVDVPPKQSSNSKPLTEPKVSESSNVIKKPNRGPSIGALLRSDPPLTGIITRLSSRSDLYYLSYKNVKIYVDRENVYLNGSVCGKYDFLMLVSSRKPVHFEAVSTDRFGSFSDITHDSTCVWTGEKPSLFEILSQMPHPKLSFLKQQNRVFEGNVIKMCLPDVALVYAYCGHTIVLLPVTAFGKSKDELITNFVKMNDRLKFTIGSLSEYPDIPCAFNVELVSKKVV